jgi:membrane protein implicated in regulation of membrane protease activity
MTKGKVYMRSIYFIILSFALVFAVPNAFGQSAPPGENSVGERFEKRVVIIEDQETGAFRFMIDDKEAAVLDAEGFHVNGSIDYSGAITDGNQYSGEYKVPPEAQ